jgi:hypothetical protein
LSDPTEPTIKVQPWELGFSFIRCKINWQSEKPQQLGQLGPQIRPLPEDAETRDLKTGDLYLCHDPHDEALTVLVRVICPADGKCIMTMEEYGELHFRWVCRHDLEDPLTQEQTAPVEE